MDKEEIIEYLKNPNKDKTILENLTELAGKVLELQEQREKLKDEYIYSIQTKIAPPDSIKVLHSNKKDVSDILERAINFINNQENELLVLENSYHQQLENHKRIYLIKNNFEREDRQIIKMYYEENLPMRAIENHFGKDHKNMTVKRNSIVDEITRIFNSSITNMELAQMKNNKEDEQMEFKNNIKGQISINKYIKDEKS